MANVINGTNFNLFTNLTGTTTGATVKALAVATSCKYSLSNGLIDITSKNDGGWDNFMDGNKSFSIDADGMVSFDTDTNSTTFDQLTNAFMNGTIVTCTFSVCSGTTNIQVVAGKSFVGKAIIEKLDVDSKVKSALAYTISLKGVGMPTWV